MPVGSRSVPLKVGCDTKQGALGMLCATWFVQHGRNGVALLITSFVKRTQAEDAVILHQHETKSKLGQKVCCAAGVLYCISSNQNTGIFSKANM